MLTTPNGARRITRRRALWCALPGPEGEARALRLIRGAMHRMRATFASPKATEPTLKRVLITQRELKNYGGSEFFAIEVARALKARGYDVAVYCPSPGKLVNILTPSGIPVCDTLDQVPFAPDIIHGQHHLPTMAALAHFPNAPAIYCWHGGRPWVEAPPIHPRVRYHVVTSARMAPRLATETGTPADRVVTIPNFVDLERFSRIRAPFETAERAVLYGQAGFHPGELAQLEDTCAANGITLDKVGPAYGNPRPRPEYFLPDYDVAFAIGRCAIEALACGCAVIPIVPQLAGSLITPQNFEEWAASNFSPRYFTSAAVMDAHWLRAQLGACTAEGVAGARDLARTHHAIGPAVDAFEALYHQALRAGPAEGSGAEFAHYLGKMAPEMDAMWGDLECRKVDDAAAQTRIKALETQLAEAERRVAHLTDRLLDQETSKTSRKP